MYWYGKIMYRESTINFRSTVVIHKYISTRTRMFKICNNWQSRVVLYVCVLLKRNIIFCREEIFRICRSSFQLWYIFLSLNICCTYVVTWLFCFGMVTHMYIKAIPSMAMPCSQVSVTEADATSSCNYFWFAVHIKGPELSSCPVNRHS